MNKTSYIHRTAQYMKKFTIISFLLLCLCMQSQCTKSTDAQKTDDTSLQQTTAAAPGAADYREFNRFWTQFRNLCLNKDYDKLSNLVHFPLVTRGPMDFHKEISFEQKDFHRVFPLFLSQPTGMDIELEEKTADAIHKITVVDFTGTNGPAMSGDRARVSDMEYKKINSQWKLALLYLEEDTYKALGITIE